MLLAAMSVQNSVASGLCPFGGASYFQSIPFTDFATQKHA